jgi:hypothetical protein
MTHLRHEFVKAIKFYYLKMTSSPSAEARGFLGSGPVVFSSPLHPRRRNVGVFANQKINKKSDVISPRPLKNNITLTILLFLHGLDIIAVL